MEAMKRVRVDVCPSPPPTTISSPEGRHTAVDQPRGSGRSPPLTLSQDPLLHSKNVFVTLTYSLSFEMRHDSRCSVTFRIHRIPTHTNGSKAIIIIGYHAITVVIKLCGMCMWTSTDCLYMSACCLTILMASLWLLWLLRNVVYYGMLRKSTISTMICYYGIIEFSVRDKH